MLFQEFFLTQMQNKIIIIIIITTTTIIIIIIIIITVILSDNMLYLSFYRILLLNFKIKLAYVYKYLKR